MKHKHRPKNRPPSESGMVTLETGMSMIPILLGLILSLTMLVQASNLVAVINAAAAGARAAALGASESYVAGIVGDSAGADARMTMSRVNDRITVTVSKPAPLIGELTSSQTVVVEPGVIP